MGKGLNKVVKYFKIWGAQRGIKIGKLLSLSHLFFDNVLSFGLDAVKDVEKYKYILDLYSTATRMEVNNNK